MWAKERHCGFAGEDRHALSSSLQEPAGPSVCSNFIPVPHVVEGDGVLKRKVVTRSPKSPLPLADHVILIWLSFNFLLRNMKIDSSKLCCRDSLRRYIWKQLDKTLLTDLKKWVEVTFNEIWMETQVRGGGPGQRAP